MALQMPKVRRRNHIGRDRYATPDSDQCDQNFSNRVLGCTRQPSATFRRLNIGAALLHDPDLLIFDEPTVAVDPQSRNAIFDTLKTLQSRGKTLIYTTHYMEEVERLCDRVAIMDHGQIIANDTLPGLRGLLPDRDRLQVELTDVAGNGWLEQLTSLAGVHLAHLHGTTLTLEIDHIGRDVPAILTWLDTRNLHIRSASTRHTALEDIFLHLTGRSLRD